jgi:hypothetical protein
MRRLLESDTGKYRDYGIAPEGMPKHMKLIYKVVPEKHDDVLVLIYETPFIGGNLWDICILEDVSKSTFCEAVYAKTNCFSRAGLDQIYEELNSEGPEYCFDPRNVMLQYSEWLEKPKDYDCATTIKLSNGHWLEKNYDTKHRY